jgi:hypothetical protein
LVSAHAFPIRRQRSPRLTNTFSGIRPVDRRFIVAQLLGAFTATFLFCGSRAKNQKAKAVAKFAACLKER